MRVEYYFSMNAPYVYIESARMAQMGAAWRYQSLHLGLNLGAL